MKFLTRILPPLLYLVTVLAFPVAAAAAPRLSDEGVLAGLRAGRSQRVIVQLLDADEATEPSATARRARRDELKSAVIARLRPEHVELKHRFGELPMLALTLKHADALQGLLDDSTVEAVFPDRERQLFLSQALPLIGQTTAAAQGYQGAGRSVAVLDTGVDYTRSELGSCTAPGVPAATCKVVATYEAALQDNALDANGHGTKVAMTAIAVAPQARVVAVDVFNGTGASDSDILAGIDWTISQRATYGISAINLSLGDASINNSPCTSSPYVLAFRRSRNAGMVVVVASGNDGYSNGIAEPACVAEAIAVGATYDANVGQRAFGACTDSTTAADKPTCYSNSGIPLDLLAPGSVITVGGASVDGTSFSSPMVAGAVAVLRARFPFDTVAQTESRLLLSGTPVTDARNGLVRPRLALAAAVAGAGGPANDAFAAAAALTGTSGKTTADSSLASTEAGEPFHFGSTGGKSLWWTWQAPASGFLTVDTAGSNFNTVLAAYTGSALTALSQIASDNDSGSGVTSLVTFVVSAGTTYRIAVDGVNGTGGSVALNWSLDVRQDQSIVFVQPDSAWLDQGTVQLSVQATSGLIVSLASDTPAVCSVSAATVTLLASGSCRIAATQAGNTTYLAAAPVTMAFDVLPARLTQTLSFATLADRALDGGTVPLAATATSGLPVTFSSLTPATCSVSAQTATLLAQGLCRIAADQAGDGSWLPAPQQVREFTIGAPSAATATDGDVPLPPWALIGLGAMLAHELRRRGRR